jgi:hypothetical protein
MLEENELYVEVLHEQEIKTIIAKKEREAAEHKEMSATMLSYSELIKKFDNFIEAQQRIRIEEKEKYDRICGIVMELIKEFKRVKRPGVENISPADNLEAKKSKLQADHQGNPFEKVLELNMKMSNI